MNLGILLVSVGISTGIGSSDMVLFVGPMDVSNTCLWLEVGVPA